MSTNMVAQAPVRERILDAAVRLLSKSGVKRLAQPQVAKAAGVPQGHLTYYFPRKLDLLAAVGKRFVEMVGRDLEVFVAGTSWERAGPPARERALEMVAKLTKDRERTRMLLGLLVEADQDATLREALAEGASFTRKTLAQVIGRPQDDPDVDIALATLWGLGIMNLVFADRMTDAEMDALIARLPEALPRRGARAPTRARAR